MLENWQPREIFLSDLDDTLVDSENKHMLRGWNQTLRPWKRAWKPYSDETAGMRMVEESERPGLGLNPREVLSYFIRLYGLRPDQVDEDHLTATGFIHQKELLALRNGWDDLDPDEQEEELVDVLERERLAYANQLVAMEGVMTTPGAVEMIKTWHESGFATGIVTQAPLPLANLMLEAAGLKTRDSKGKVREKYYDVVVSSGMASGKHKPDPHHLQMTATIIHWNDLIRGIVPGLSEDDRLHLLRERRETWQRRSQGFNSESNFKKQLYQEVRSRTVSGYPPVVYCGDSSSDARAVSGWRQQEGVRLPIVFRIHDYTETDTLKEIVGGDYFFVGDLSTVTPEWIEQ